jgi:hypothetical protein
MRENPPNFPIFRAAKLNLTWSEAAEDVIVNILAMNQDGSPCRVVTTIIPRASKKDSSMSNISCWTAGCKFYAFMMQNKDNNGSVCRFHVLSSVVSEIKSNYFL